MPVHLNGTTSSHNSDHNGDDATDDISSHNIPASSDQDILSQAQEEHLLSKNYVDAKRVQFRDRKKMYNNQKKNREKIGVTTMYTTMNILLAVHYTDELNAEFASRRMGFEREADKWQKLAEFDKDEMGLDQVEYMTQWDKLFYGVGIRVISSYDKVTKTPIIESKSPLSWLPDPKGGVGRRKHTPYRWHGFEVEYTKDSMTEKRGFIESQVARLNTMGEVDPDQKTTEDEQNEAYGLDSTTEPTSSPNVIHQCFDWLMIIDGVKHLVTFNANFTLILRKQKLIAVTKEEEQDPSRIPFPVALNYYSPNRADPFGTSVCDLTEDKQRTLSVLMNLRVAIEKARLYPMYMYNRYKIRNKRDLDFGFQKFIAINGDVNNDVIQPIPKDLGTTQSELTLEKDLERLANSATGADEVQAGILSESARTASEIQQKQANANLRFILSSRINAWGEKTMWKLWQREYRKNFGGADEKIIRVTGGFGFRFITLRKKDFITETDPDITIVSKIESDGKKSRLRDSYSRIFALIQQDPTRPEASKKFFERKMLGLQEEMTQEQVDIISPPTPDEVKALEENELLSHGDFVPINTGEDDHFSHNVIHSAADDTPATRAHRAAHNQAYIVSGQQAKNRALAAEGDDQMKVLATQEQAQVGARASKDQAPSVPNLAQ